jgi:hypothetical protein
VISGKNLRFIINTAVSSQVDPALLQIRETLRRLDMRLRPVLSSPAEMDAMLAEFHGVRG